MNLSLYFASEDDSTAPFGILGDPTEGRVWRQFVGQAILAIDAVLELAEGA